MRCYYDFHMHQLVHASQMLEEFENFYYNRNVDNGSWYGKPNVLPASHLLWFMDSQISGKGFLKKYSWEKEKISDSLPPLRENPRTYVKQSQCCEVFTIHHDLIYESFDS